MDNTLILIFQVLALLFSVVIHEVSHGVMALRLGDPTAKLAGRLTINPIKHLDPVGSIILPIIFILTNSPIILGWAKPVPYNPMLLMKDYKYGSLKVALAGPLANLFLALIFGTMIRIGFSVLDPVTISLLSVIVYINCLLFVFNLLPIPPLDGSKILTTILPPHYARRIQFMGIEGIFIVLLFLFLFGDIIFYLSYSLFSFLVGDTSANIFLNFIK